MTPQDNLVSLRGRMIVVQWVRFVAVIVLFSSPFFWIWGMWPLAWKVFITGFLGFAITSGMIGFYREMYDQIRKKYYG